MQVDGMAIISVTLFLESENQTVEEMESVIGVPTGGGWQKGDPRGRTGKTFKTNAWKQVEKTTVLDDPDQFLAALQRSVTAVLSRINGHERQFRLVASSCTSGLIIGVSSKTVPPFVLSAELLDRIASLGVDFEVDLTLD